MSSKRRSGTQISDLSPPQQGKVSSSSVVGSHAGGGKRQQLVPPARCSAIELLRMSCSL